MHEKNVVSITPAVGYSPHIGMLVSTLAHYRAKTIRWVQGLAIYQLDYLYDATANSIGALLLHMAALEAAVQDYTFHGIPLENPDWSERWGLAMYLGDRAREEIRGNPVEFYLDTLERVRAEILNQLRSCKDDWLW
jgi:hypothetical protein